MSGVGWGWALPMIIGGALTGIIGMVGNLLSSWLNAKNQARTTSGNVGSSSADTVFREQQNHINNLTKDNERLRAQETRYLELQRHVWELEQMVASFEEHLKACVVAT